MSRKIHLYGCHLGFKKLQITVSDIISIINMLRYVLHTCNRDGASQMNLNI